MKVALVYDRVNKWGGAERVLLSLHKIFPKAPLFTSVYDAKNAPWAKVFTIKTSFLQKFPFAKEHHDWYAPLMPLAFESFSFDEYDVVISITSEAAKGIITKPQTRHICLSLTPTRYLWSGYDNYFGNPLLKTLAYPVVWLLRKWDFAAAQRPDFYIAISQEVADRIKRYYKKIAPVIYPALGLKVRPKKSQKNDYFLVVSRLVKYKRIDIAIKACSSLGLPLKIIGTGSEEAQLKALAGPTVEFLGSLTDAELIGYYNDCCALIFPGLEDFGLTVVEAQAYGKPVIAYKAGGVLETVISGKTGEFFSPQTADALEKKLQLLLKKGKISLGKKRNKYRTKAKENAKRFTHESFKNELLSFIKTHTL